MGEIILVVLVYSIGMYLAIEKTAGFNTTEESFTATLYTTSVHEKAFQMIAVAVRKLKQRRGLLNMHRQRCSVAQLLNVPYEPTGVVECTPLLLIFAAAYGRLAEEADTLRFWWQLHAAFVFAFPQPSKHVVNLKEHKTPKSYSFHFTLV